MAENEEDTRYARWLNGQLNEQEQSELEADGTLDDLQKIIDTTDQLTMGKYDAEGAFAKLKANRTTSTAKVRPLRPNWAWAAAAAVLLLLVAGIGFFIRSDQQITATAQNTVAFTFQDGSKVLLNDGSALRYKEAEWEEERRTKLTGEAYFEVEKGQAFYVSTPNGMVQVLGTRFNVRAWGKGLRVECYEGRVLVTAQDQSLELRANQAAQLVGSKLAQAGSLDHARPLWEEGTSRFYQASAQEVFDELERQFAVRVRNKAKAADSFSGVFTHGDLEEALQQICIPLGLSFQIAEDQQVVEIN
ncbi:MAG: FecR domain-containing protein [Bacteroidota bacterium]